MEEVPVANEKGVVREPLLAGILSGICLGLGQAYNGQRRKGYLFFASQLGLALLLLILMKLFNEPFRRGGKEMSYSSPSCIITWIVGLCVWVFNIYDAYQSAKRINASEEVMTSTPGRSAFIFIRTILLCIPLTIVIIVMLAVCASILFRR